MHTYNFHLEKSLEKIKEYLFERRIRPILFIGSGFSQRYINSPTWKELLEQLIHENSDINKPLQYYLQQYGEDYPNIASVLTEKYREYAWEHIETSDEFPEFTFESESNSIHLKYKISSILKEKMNSFDTENNELNNEINLLKDLNPQAIITTNYDNLLEFLFPKYETIVGQEVIYKKESTNIGHILQIHGSVDDFDSIVINKEDYDIFKNKRTYLNAKLLTYFIEYPVFFIGYSLTDENIKSILFDIKQITNQETEPMIENMWFIDWSKEPIKEEEVLVQVKSFSVGNGESVKINYIKLHTYEKLYEALYQDSVDIGILKKIEETVYNVIKSDTIMDLKIDMVSLQHLTNRQKFFESFTMAASEETEEENLNVFTFADITDANQLAARYSLTASELSTEVFGIEKHHWSHAYKLIQIITEEKGINLRESNNKYHVRLAGRVTAYSMDMVSLLKKVKENELYELELVGSSTLEA